LSDQVKDDDTHGTDEKWIQYIGCKSGKEETTRQIRRTWEDNIRMNRKEIRWEGVDWMCLA